MYIILNEPESIIWQIEAKHNEFCFFWEQNLNLS